MARVCLMRSNSGIFWRKWPKNGALYQSYQPEGTSFGKIASFEPSRVLLRSLFVVRIGCAPDWVTKKELLITDIFTWCLWRDAVRLCNLGEIWQIMCFTMAWIICHIFVWLFQEKREKSHFPIHLYSFHNTAAWPKLSAAVHPHDKWNPYSLRELEASFSNRSRRNLARDCQHNRIATYHVCRLRGLHFAPGRKPLFPIGSYIGLYI